MEEEKNTSPEQENSGYVPRPAWQVWGARIGLILFVLFVIYQMILIRTGGGV